MSKPILAIFADTPAQQAYLGDIARLAGFEGSFSSDRMDDALGILTVRLPCDGGRNFNGKPVIALGAPKNDELNQYDNNVRVLSSPVKARDVIKMLLDLARQSLLPAFLAIGDHQLHPRDYSFVRPDGSIIRLTEKETAILVHLKAAPNQTLSRQSLLDKVWSYADGVETHTLETHIYRLRQKIEPNPSSPVLLLTQGDGYSLQG